MKNLFAKRPGDEGPIEARAKTRGETPKPPEAALFDLLRRKRGNGELRPRPELPLAALGTDFDIGPNG
jgi:hypothetical protein